MYAMEKHYFGPLHVFRKGYWHSSKKEESMVDRFLEAKHWQMFVLTFGIPLVFQFLMMGSIVSRIAASQNPDPEIIFGYFKFFPLMMILFMGFLLGWYWSVGVGLQRFIPTDVKLKVNRFKIFLLIPAVYVVFFLGFFMTLMGSGGPSPILFAFIFPLHFFSMFCLLYCLYFVAKTIKTAELQRKVTFSDFAGEFFMIWFYPIGIWIIQPKINQMVKERGYTAGEA